MLGPKDWMICPFMDAEDAYASIQASWWVKQIELASLLLNAGISYHAEWHFCFTLTLDYMIQVHYCTFISQSAPSHHKYALGVTAS